ncbi:Mediator of RNA polymerase II transcription subunit 28 [Frankliniella fusca]|uniref:Mediator of RNA polymerase II transcription subunit 28 n=1 Tax=Frankliniella fusca TaxID=407009 RepID=A0AAE1GWS8_9NEOP|nr:Mediator of RNA polymerase II transcription subunit 28 [Frankliniella fusca]
MINKMANTTNENGNLVDEFEEAFQACLNVLTRDDALAHMEKDEVRAEVDQTISRVIDLARQTEGYFLQKRFLLSALKPELIVKEDISDLKGELARKDELIKKHYEKINQWQNLLMDLRSAQGQPQAGQPPGQLMGQPNGSRYGLTTAINVHGKSLTSSIPALPPRPPGLPGEDHQQHWNGRWTTVTRAREG